MKSVGSPSLQLKRNASRIKRIIENTGKFKGINIDYAVVFTNRNSFLNLKNQTVTVLKLPQLPGYLISHFKVRLYSNQELEFIAKLLVKAEY